MRTKFWAKSAGMPFMVMPNRSAEPARRPVANHSAHVTAGLLIGTIENVSITFMDERYSMLK